MTTHDRYQVVTVFANGETDLVDAYASKWGSIVSATRVAMDLPRDGSRVEVFDAMAHVGAPELWLVSATGQIMISRRRAS